MNLYPERDTYVGENYIQWVYISFLPIEFVILELDERGRITIPKEWRENLQLKRTVAIRSKQGILLIPLSNDPLNSLKGSFRTDKSVNELKQQVSKFLEKEN